jgi:hypothetical protein
LLSHDIGDELCCKTKLKSVPPSTESIAREYEKAR